MDPSLCLYIFEVAPNKSPSTAEEVLQVILKSSELVSLQVLQIQMFHIRHLFCEALLHGRRMTIGYPKTLLCKHSAILSMLQRILAKHLLYFHKSQETPADIWRSSCCNLQMKTEYLYSNVLFHRHL